MSDKIAIVGMAGRFPAANDVGELWHMLAAGREATRWPSDEELLAAGVTASELEDPDYVRATLALPDMECFDASFFGMSPKEAAIMDPQHRHFIECCWEALEDAGCVPAKFGGAIGVFGGCGMQAYMAFNLLANRALMSEAGMFLVRHTGNDKDFLTTRASYLMGLTGPSVGVQTACSTSLVAVHLACQSLLSGECDLALAGGVSIELPHRRGYRWVENEILARDGHCRAFDNAATGTIFGSGASVVALRRLEDAISDGDNIRAVILGTAINNDGASKAGYLAPSVSGQARAAAEALAIAGLKPDQIDYIEAHGTGTVIGDPIELTALAEAYATENTSHRISIGSLKTNIGHLDTAAGAAGLIKVVLALEHGVVPRTLNYSTPNGRFDLAGGPFAIADTERPWRASSRPRRGAVNSLGVGGTNAHVIVEEAPRVASPSQSDAPELFVLSAKTKTSLEQLRTRWQTFSERTGAGVDLANAAYTSREGRTAFAHREVAVASSLAQLSEMLKQPSHAFRAADEADDACRIVFMYPGGGAQYPGAAKGLYRNNAIFRAACDDAFAIVPQAKSDTLRRLMFEVENGDAAMAQLQQPSNAVMAVFILEYALTRMWAHWGIEPSIVIGHSAGDYAAAVAAGVMSLADALACIALRGEIFERMPPGGMLLIGADVAATRKLVGPSLDIAAANAADMTVVSGDAADIDRVAQWLADGDIVCQRVPIKVAAHSRALDPYLGEFRALLASLELSPPRIPFVSNLDGRLMTGAEAMSADYWCRHLRETVRFGDGLASVLASPDAILLEVGPGQALSAIARQSEGAHRPRAIVPSTRHVNDTVSDEAFALLACGRLWASGAEPDFAALREGRSLRRISVPTYAFERQRHWIDADPIDRVVDSAKPAGVSPAGGQALRRLADPSSWFFALEWQQRALPRGTVSAERQNGTWVLIGDAPQLAAIRGELERRNRRFIEVGSKLAQSHEPGSYCLRPGNLDDYLDLVETLRNRPDTIGQIVVALASNASTLEARASDVFAQAFHLLKALVIADWDRELDVTFLTPGAWSVDGVAAVDPAYAAAFGPARVISHENAYLRARVIDIADDDWRNTATPSGLIDELETAAQAAAIALRQGRRYQLEPLQPHGEPAVVPRVRQAGAYLITGAAGGVAAMLALHLARKHGARLALVARLQVPDRSSWPQVIASGGRLARYLRHLVELESSGCQVLPLVADVTDADQMAAAIGKARETFGELHGVFHLAGRIDDALIAAKQLEDAAAVMRPKVDGAAVLDRLLPDGSIELFAVMSSVSAVVGPPGQSDYVAANAVQDAIASARSDGLVITSGIWADVGMAAKPHVRAAEHVTSRTETSHPLLGTMSRDGDHAVTFSASYDPEEIGILEDHQINATSVLPGVAYLEIARAAIAAITGPDVVVDLRNANIVAPMAFPDGQTRAVETHVEALSPTSFRIAVSSSSATSREPTQHFEAAVALSVADRSARLPVPLVQSEHRTAAGGRGLQMVQRDHIAFGPRFDVLTELAVAEGKSASAIVELAPRFAGELAQLAAHPALVDVAATVGLFTLPQVRRDHKLFVPMSIRRVSGLGRLPARFSTRATLDPSSDDSIVTFDVIFADTAGHVLMRLEGLSLKAIEQGTLQLGEPDASALGDVLRAGLRRQDAETVFDRVLSTSARNVVVSSIGVPTLLARLSPPVRKAMTRSAQPAGDQYASDAEAKLAAMMGELLGIDRVAPHDDFFAMGGQSITAVRLFAKIRREWKIDLPLATLFQARTVRALAKLVAADASSGEPQIDAAETLPAPKSTVSKTKPAAGESVPFPTARWSPLVTITPGRSDHVPVYCIHGAGGNVLSSMPLSKALGSDVPFIGLQAQGVDGLLPPLECIEEMARLYLNAIRMADPDGPRCILGYSGGGVIAFEICRLLHREGRKVDLCVMIDSLAPIAAQRPARVMDWVRYGIDQGAYALSTQFASAYRDRMRKLFPSRSVPVSDIMELRSAEVFDAYVRAQSKYRPEPLTVDVLLFRATRASVSFHRAGHALGWDELVGGRLDVVKVDADHVTVVAPDNAAMIARHINARFAEVQRTFCRVALKGRTVA